MRDNKQFKLDELLITKNSAANILPVCDHYAGTERTIKKALLLQSKLWPNLDVTLDFEDGSSSGDELYQRDLISDALNSQDNAYSRIGVRIHSAQTSHWKLDIDAIIKKHGRLPTYINIPKVQSLLEVQQVSSYIKNRLSICCRELSLPIHIMVEDALALSRVDVLMNCGLVECASFGLLDFVSSFGGAIPVNAMQSPLQFEHPLVRDAKIKLSLACHAAGVIPSHSITTDIHNSASAFQDARRAREEFGYLRMWSIHPSQIEQIINAFQYDERELEEAIEILEKALKVNFAPILFNKIMHDKASYRFFWIKLRRAILNGWNFHKSVNELFQKI